MPELPKAIIDGLTHRVGRYPSKADGGPSWRGVIMDRKYDDDHWYFRWLKRKRRWASSSEFFRQPGRVLECHWRSCRYAEAQGYTHQAGKWWQTNPQAEYEEPADGLL